MKRQIVICVLGLISFVSCTDEVKETVEPKEEVITMDDMCDCTTDLIALMGKKMGEVGSNQELEKEFEAKSMECEKISQYLEKGKTEEEIEAMGEEFIEFCPAVKEIMEASY